MHAYIASIFRLREVNGDRVIFFVFSLEDLFFLFMEPRIRRRVDIPPITKSS